MKKNSLIWEITSKESGAVSYLMGTMHVRDARAFNWLAMARYYIDECDFFATEFDFMEADPEAFAAAMRMPEGASLQQFLPRNAWKQLDFLAQKKLGADAAALQFQHPMAVSTLLTTASMAEEMTISLDETLYRYAKDGGKTTLGVESFEDQIDTLKSIPFEQHIKGLAWLLKNQNRHQRRLKKMMLDYTAGNLQSLYKAAKKDAKGMRKILLYRRNKRMARRFAEIAEQQTLFCAVGAGHLPGGKGMLRLLKKKGFRVKPVHYREMPDFSAPFFV